MLRVESARWGQTPADLRQLATSAPHPRTRERFLAFYEITQESCATRVAERTRRHPQTVMEWLHLYNTRGPEALVYQRTGGRPPLPGDRERPWRDNPCRPTLRRSPAHSRSRSRAALDPAPSGRLGARAVRPDLLPGDPPRRPASSGIVVEEGQKAARPGRPATPAGLCRADPGSADRCPARPPSPGLLGRSPHPPGCRPRLWLVGARPAPLDRLALAASVGQALVLRSLSLQRRPSAALALCVRQRRAHRRCSAPAPSRMARGQADRRLGRRLLSSSLCGARSSRSVTDRPRAVARLQPRLNAGRGALALAPRGCHLSSLPSHRRGSQPARDRFRNTPQSGPLRRRRPPLGQRSPRP